MKTPGTGDLEVFGAARHTIPILPRDTPRRQSGMRTPGTGDLEVFWAARHTIPILPRDTPRRQSGMRLRVPVILKCLGGQTHNPNIAEGHPRRQSGMRLRVPVILKCFAGAINRLTGTWETSAPFLPVTQWIGASKWVPVCSPVEMLFQYHAGPASLYRLISVSANGLRKIRCLLGVSVCLDVWVRQVAAKKKPRRFWAYEALFRRVEGSRCATLPPPKVPFSAGE